jgi:hypothetical protein
MKLYIKVEYVPATGGFGVDEREPPHGDMDSTAAVRYDFSGFSDLLSGAGSILSSLPATPCFLVQWRAVADFSTLSGRYFGTFLACWATDLR